jgi:hypothetical protein
MTLKIAKNKSLRDFSSSLSLLKFSFMVCNNFEMVSNTGIEPFSHFGIIEEIIRWNCIQFHQFMMRDKSIIILIDDFTRVFALAYGSTNGCVKISIHLCNTTHNFGISSQRIRMHFE